MSEEKQNQSSLCSEREASSRLGISRITLLRARGAGRVRFYKVGTRILYSEQQLAEFLERCEHNGSDRHDPEPNESEVRHER